MSFGLAALRPALLGMALPEAMRGRVGATTITFELLETSTRCRRPVVDPTGRRHDHDPNVYVFRVCTDGAVPWVAALTANCQAPDCAWYSGSSAPEPVGRRLDVCMGPSYLRYRGLVLRVDGHQLLDVLCPR